MKQILTLLTLSAGVAFAQQSEMPALPAPVQIDSNQVKEIASYTIGYSMGLQLLADSNTVDTAIVLEALNNTMAGKDPRFSETEMQTAMATFQRQQQEAALAQYTEAGKEFLKNNATNANVVVTASGLQYQVEALGDGDKPVATDSVSVHYTGRLINGRVFDSSVQRGEPATFSLNGVIPGWTEGLQLMPVGSKFIFFVPSELAYGERPPPRSQIPPNSVLIFEVELLTINK